MSDRSKETPPATPRYQLGRQETFYVHKVDPFAHEGRFFGHVFNAVLATGALLIAIGYIVLTTDLALFRCWYLILLSTAWATLIGCLIEFQHVNLNIQTTLLTV